MIQSKPGMSLWLKTGSDTLRPSYTNSPSDLSCALVTYSWTPPRYVLSMSEERHERVRKKYHILVEGDGIPPPIKSFKEMKFPAGTGGRGSCHDFTVMPLRLCSPTSPS